MENKLRETFNEMLKIIDCSVNLDWLSEDREDEAFEVLETLINKHYVRKEEEKHLFTFNTIFSVIASSRDEARKKVCELTGWRDDHLELTGLEPKTNTNKEETKHGTK